MCVSVDTALHTGGAVCIQTAELNIRIRTETATRCIILSYFQAITKDFKQDLTLQYDRHRLVYNLKLVLTYLLTYLFQGVILRKLKSYLLVKKFPSFYEKRRFITVLTSASHLFVSRASSIQSIHPFTLLENPSQHYLHF